MQPDPTLPYRKQHKLRLSYMPWLYWGLKPQQRAWARAWQREWQDYLVSVETIEIQGECFIAPQARLFAEPGRPIVVDAGSFIAADAVLHGPLHIGRDVSINHHASLDGGRAGITLGEGTRLAAYTHLYAFNHGQAADRPMHRQKVTSSGICIGRDVWVGAHTGIVDGVTIGDGAIVGMNSLVSRDVAPGIKVAGNPARPIAER